MNVLSSYWSHFARNYPFGEVEMPIVTIVDIDGHEQTELKYVCLPEQLLSLNIAYGKIFQSRSFNPRPINPNVICEEMFYVHSDHLGSASWITNEYGEPVQYLHYAPYGELLANQRTTGYDERFKYIGKERDAESNYDNFGARYWWSSGGHWLSVDPLADKNPDISPYAYCAWNPIKYVDPDGRDIYTFDSDGNFTGNVIKQDGDHIGRIYLSKDKYMDFSFNDQSYADRICELYSDQYYSLAGQNNPDLSPITHVSIISNEQINTDLPLKDFEYLGVMDAIIGTCGGKTGALLYACGGTASISYAYLESRRGKLDFVNKAKGLIQDNGFSLFLPLDGEKVLYDSFDFGNYIWGQSMRRLGISLNLSILGAHVDCWRQHKQLDSKADQRAIRNGYKFNMR